MLSLPVCERNNCGEKKFHVDETSAAYRAVTFSFQIAVGG
jgi:hypothetical protein